MINRRTMIGGAAALGATAAVAGIPEIPAAIRAADTFSDSDHPILRHAGAIDAFLKVRDDLGFKVGGVKAHDNRLKPCLPIFAPKGDMALSREIKAAYRAKAESRPDVRFGTISIMALGIDFGSSDGEHGIVMLIDDNGRPGDKVGCMHRLGRGESALEVRSPESRRQWGISGVLVMRLGDHGEAGVNATMKIFGAFLHHLHGEPDWIPKWATSGEYQPEFAARIVNDRRKSTWIA